MEHLRILILGDSRVLSRPWENKVSYFEPVLKKQLKIHHPHINFVIKTIAMPNKLLTSLTKDYQEIIDFFPDIIIFNLNLCDYIPRSLPKKLFDYLEQLQDTSPQFVESIRRFLARHRRLIHKVFGKNSWNNQKGYTTQLINELDKLKQVTPHIIGLSCLHTSESSEYIRPGFQKDITMFNDVTNKIFEENGLVFLDINPILEKHHYQAISKDGIHYTDQGDEILINFLISNKLNKLIAIVCNNGTSISYPKKPNYIQVELTNICSVQCTMCELNKCTRPKGYMSEEQFRIIINQLVEWQIPMIRFTLWGEAMLHPKFYEFIHIAKEYGMKVGFNTNGVLLNDKNIKQIIDSNVDEIIFSLDSFDDQNIYELFRPSNKRISEINEAILKLINSKIENNRDNLQVRVQMIGSELNITQHNKFMDFWKSKVASCRVTHLYSMEKLKKYNPNITEEFDYFHECLYPWTTLGIYHNGDVTACCRDVNGKLKLGNVMDKSLRELYHSEYITDMRKNLILKNKNDMPDFCKQCYKYLLKVNAN